MSRHTDGFFYLDKLANLNIVDLLLYKLVRTFQIPFREWKDKTTTSYTSCMNVATTNNIPHLTTRMPIRTRVGRICIASSTSNDIPFIIGIEGGILTSSDIDTASTNGSQKNVKIAKITFTSENMGVLFAS